MTRSPVNEDAKGGKGGKESMEVRTEVDGGGLSWVRSSREDDLQGGRCIREHPDRRDVWVGKEPGEHGAEAWARANISASKEEDLEPPKGQRVRRRLYRGRSPDRRIRSHRPSLIRL